MEEDSTKQRHSPGAREAETEGEEILDSDREQAKKNPEAMPKMLDWQYPLPS